MWCKQLPKALQVLPPPAPALLGAPALDVNPEKDCQNVKCYMFNHLKPFSKTAENGQMCESRKNKNKKYSPGHCQQPLCWPFKTKTKSVPWCSFGTIKNHLDSFGSIWDHLGPLRTIWDHLGQFGTIWDHLGPLGTTWDHLGSFGFVWNHLGPFETI